MKNADYIKAYKGEERILSDYYRLKDKSGKRVVIDGMVTPSKIDNRQLMAPTDDQTDSPHCAAYAAATMAESLYWKKTGILKQMDAHQIYALAKQIDGKPRTEGTYLEAALRAAVSLGCFADVFAEPKTNRLWNDKTNDTVKSIKRLLHKHDILIAGFDIDDGWSENRVRRNGLRIKKEGFSRGGHAVCICGYDSRSFFIQNQWGRTWGAKGFAMMSYAVLLEELTYCAWVE